MFRVLFVKEGHPATINHETRRVSCTVRDEGGSRPLSTFFLCVCSLSTYFYDSVQCVYWHKPLYINPQHHCLAPKCKWQLGIRFFFFGFHFGGGREASTGVTHTKLTV